MTNETMTTEPLFFLHAEDGNHAVMTAAEIVEAFKAHSWEIGNNNGLVTLTVIEDETHGHVFMGFSPVTKWQQAVVADENIPARHVATRDGIRYTSYQVWHMFGAEDVDATPAYKN